MHNPALPLLGLLLALFLIGPATAQDYKVGDRLGKTPDNAKAGSFRTLEWDDLMPSDWNPMKFIQDLKLDTLQDSDPRAMEAMEKLKAKWNAAPANPALNGARIRIAGFVVPLEWSEKAMTEFLLVPYFGACVHVPPPPANQIIHVTTAKPYKSRGYMDAVWVSGVLSTGFSKTEMGDSVYRLKASRVEHYTEPRR